VLEGVTGDSVNDLRTEPTSHVRLVDDEDTRRSLDNSSYRRFVERVQPAKIEHRNRDAIGSEQLSGAHRLTDVPSPGHHGKILPFTDETCNAEFLDGSIKRDRALLLVEQATLVQNDGVGTCDCSARHRVGILRTRGKPDSPSRNASEERFKALDIPVHTTQV